MNYFMKIFEFFLAIFKFIVNFALWILCLPFVPIIWIIREIKKDEKQRKSKSP